MLVRRVHIGAWVGIQQQPLSRTLHAAAGSGLEPLTQQRAYLGAREAGGVLRRRAAGRRQPPACRPHRLVFRSLAVVSGCVFPSQDCMRARERALAAGAQAVAAAEAALARCAQAVAVAAAEAAAAFLRSSVTVFSRLRKVWL